MSNNKNIYTKQIINEKIILKYSEVNNNLEDNIKNILKNKLENKCTINGFVKKDSLKIIEISCGELVSDSIMFNVVIECLISCPYESMILECKVESSTKVGLKCSIIDEDGNSPYLIFVARDHNYSNSKFTSANVEDIIFVRVIGHRFELNDPFISVIGELVEEDVKSSQTPKSSKKKKTLSINSEQ
tara:strand:- start:3935 stop:4495 length:561 start_codon:yes stop_codon:yes gene_type:complete